MPQVWGMLAPFIWSWQARRVDKDHKTVTRCRLELSGRNSAAGQCIWSPILWASHRYASIRHCWTHCQLWSRKWTPSLLLLSLYRVFQGSILPSLENQYDWGTSCSGELHNSLEASADSTWKACVSTCTAASSDERGLTPPSCLISRQPCENHLAHLMGNPSCIPTVFLQVIKQGFIKHLVRFA